jgi:hypothetical protein
VHLAVSAFCNYLVKCLNLLYLLLLLLKIAATFMVYVHNCSLKRIFLLGFLRKAGFYVQSRNRVKHCCNILN